MRQPGPKGVTGLPPARLRSLGIARPRFRCTACGFNRVSEWTDRLVPDVRIVACAWCGTVVE